MAQCFGTDSGQLFNRFVFNDDGTVSGYFNDIDETSITSYGSTPITDNPSSLPKECCTALGYTFDSQSGKCFYAEPCAEDDTVKVLFGIDQMDGFNFQVVSGETASLEIKFDYIFKYDCNTLFDCGTAEAKDLLSGITGLEYTRNEISNQLSGYTAQFQFLTENPSTAPGFEELMTSLQEKITFLSGQTIQIDSDLEVLNARYSEISGGTIADILSNFNATVSIDRVDPPVSGTTPVYTTITELPLLSIGDFEEYITDNPTTGLIITCDDCGLVDTVLREELDDPTVLTEETINSDWLNFETVINDTAIISAITNEDIHISIKIDDVRCNTSILVDRISVNKLSTFLEREEVYVSKCPGFDLKRLVDNKKSWTQVSKTTNREYDFETRETKYSLNDSKLVVNTKELDLNVDAANAVEFDLTQYVKNNFECILTGSTTDFSELLSSDISEVMTKDELIDILTTELIDAKTRKVLSGYPTLKKFFEIYTGAVSTTCTTSNMLSITEVDMFIDLFGDYWTDIVEQFIPATTIWGSTNIYRNTAFCTDKYKYTPNTINWGCGSGLTQTIITGDTATTNVNRLAFISGFDYNTVPRPLSIDASGKIYDNIGNELTFLPTTSTNPWDVPGDFINQSSIWLNGLADGNWGYVTSNITVSTTKDYYLAISANNFYTLKINGEDYIDASPFSLNDVVTTIYPVNLVSGVNEIEFGFRHDFDANTTGKTISAEIYDATVTDIINAPDRATIETYKIYSLSEEISSVVGSEDDYLTVNVGVEVMPPDVNPNDCDTTLIERYDNICLIKVDNGAEYLGSIEVRDGGIVNNAW